MGQVAHQPVALGVDVRPDVVGDLAGGVAQADAPVERHGPDPEGHAAPTQVVRLPEPDVVAVAGALARRLLEGEVLLAAEDEEGADRGVGVGPVHQDAAGDPEAAPQGHRVGGVPARVEHGPDQVVLGADQADVERVAGDALGGEGRLGGVFEGRVVLVVPPEGREDQVRRQQPQGGDDEKRLGGPDEESPPAGRRRPPSVFLARSGENWISPALHFGPEAGSDNLLMTDSPGSTPLFHPTIHAGRPILESSGGVSTSTMPTPRPLPTYRMPSSCHDAAHGDRSQ